MDRQFISLVKSISHKTDRCLISYCGHRTERLIEYVNYSRALTWYCHALFFLAYISQIMVDETKKELFENKKTTWNGIY